MLKLLILLQKVLLNDICIKLNYFILLFIRCYISSIRSLYMQIEIYKKLIDNDITSNK
jgi:hypothetical protein